MSWQGRYTKGAGPSARLIRRGEAEARNERTPVDRRRAYRRTLIAFANRLTEGGS